MRTLKITILALIISISTAFGQSGNKVITTDLRKTLIVSENGSYYIKQHETTEESSPVILDPEDKNKTNQSVLRLPTHVKKIIKIDFDRDVEYDKEVEINYLRYKDITLNFDFDETGIITTTNNPFINVLKVKDKVSFENTLLMKIDKEGIYSIILSDGGEIELTVSNLRMIK